MSGIFDLLDQILPNSDRKKHDILRLEYLSACKIIENEEFTMQIFPMLPASMFDTLLQTVIYKSYLDFINIDDLAIQEFEDYSDYFNKREIAFPESLRILILNWPYPELVLKTKIPPLHPPVDIFQLNNGQLAKQNQSICQVEDMLIVFETFCNRLIQFITEGVFKCTSKHSKGISCNLRRLVVSGIGDFRRLYRRNNFICFSPPDDILEGIRSSTIDTFGHKIEIFADVEFNMLEGGYELLKNIIDESLNPDLGISVCFTKVSASFLEVRDVPPPADFYRVLAVGRCKYIYLRYVCIDGSFTKNLCDHLPELFGLGLKFTRSIESLDFLSVFENLEDLHCYYDLCCPRFYGLINSISNMSKGLEYLDISECSLQSSDIECLANSIHSDTLIELDISSNEIINAPDDVGLIMLCQKLNNVKVLNVEECYLEILSSPSIIKLVNAFNYCIELEFLSIRDNTFSVENTKIVTNGLAKNISLRYLSLDLPVSQFNSCKTFHETINKFRLSPIYISW